MAASPESWQAAGFGLYVHWPYCQAKCPYCDFNSHVVASVDEERWIRAYSGEIRRLAAETGTRVLRSIFFGGGTPSLMSARLVGSVIDTAAEVWTPANDIEITLEANPTSTEAARFAGYRTAGVNRVSVGLQALNDADLKSLGRLHSAAEGRAAFDVACSTFPRASFDLIYARQHQSLAAWEAELDEALALGPDHLSLYQLTIEDGTAFGDRFRRGKLPGLPDEDLSADMFELTQSMTEAAGLPAYEISNHATPGNESRHNLIYWQAGDYAGIGPGAHGRLTLGGQRSATETPLAPLDWLSRVERDGKGETVRSTIPAEDQTAERLMMGLRLTEGMDMDAFGDVILSKINVLEADGLLTLDGGRVRLTRSGRPLLNAILRELLA